MLKYSAATIGITGGPRFFIVLKNEKERQPDARRKRGRFPALLRIGMVRKWIITKIY
jgi:hypothetical protein